MSLGFWFNIDYKWYRVVQHYEQIITLTKLLDAHKNSASTRRKNQGINISDLFYADHARSGKTCELAAKAIDSASKSGFFAIFCSRILL